MPRFSCRTQRDRFVANVSHELRTPLTGVFAVYDLLQRRPLPPDERELVGSLGNAITTLRSSVDAVLQMSKLEAGAERAESQLFSLRYFLQQLSARVSPQALAKNLAWSVDIDEFVPSAVLGDPNHLQHTLGNLINNALKFTPKGSVSLRVQPTRTGVRFEVTDTGIGIPLEKQESLFERFVQVDQSATRKYGGTGLGTSIAHDLVKLMHGNIGVTSAPGHGSTFWVELPLNSPEREFRPTRFDSAREVLVLGRRGDDRDEIAAALMGLGLKPVPLDIDLVKPPSFDSRKFLAAVLALPAVEAAAYADAVLRERTGKICPWLVIARSCTTMQEAVLLRSGAVDVISQHATDRDLLVQLSALVYRLDVSAAEIVPTTSGQLRSLNIMLADDNRSNQLLLGRILTDAGHNVSYVARGDEAFDLMIAADLDLAILDLNMPEMSGPDVVKVFRSGEVGSDVRLPIIILSADATPDARRESLDAGANDYLTKPVTASSLLSAIERVIEGSRHRSLSPKVVFSHGSELRDDKSLESPGLVDQERIEALRRIGNNDRTFLDQFSMATFEDLESAINDLRAATRKGDIRAAREALHKIDGTSASIGATALGASAKNMRNYLSETSDSDVAAALAELSTTCALTKSAVVAVLHQPRVSSRNHH